MTESKLKKIVCPIDLPSGRTFYMRVGSGFDEFVGLGPPVIECEKAVAQYSNCAFGVGVSSGTDALLICLMAEEKGAWQEFDTWFLGVR